MSDIHYDVDGNIVKARFTKPWVDKFSAELFNRFCKKSPASIGGEMNCKYNLTSYLVYDKILLKRG